MKELKTGSIASVVVRVACAGCLVLSGACAISSGDEPDQPIAYNHKLHIETVGLECAECHRYVETSAAATLPPLEVCRSCHESDPLTESPEETVLLTYVADGTEIPWKRIYHVPDHVYFSHRRHVVLGELDCSLCHGVLQEQTTPVRSAFLEVKMENCMDCHREHKVTNDCLSCHR